MRYAFAVALLLGCCSSSQAQDFSGNWDVSGNDPARGPFAGAATVRRNGGGYDVQHLVRYTNKLPDGRTLALSWLGTGKAGSGGLEVQATLARQEFVSQGAGLARGPADRTPLQLAAVLRDPTNPSTPVVPVRIDGSFSSILGAGPTETWTRTSRQLAAFPAIDRRLVATHGPPSSLFRTIAFLLFRDFHQLPAVQPFVARPEFKAAVHGMWNDVTGKAYLRANPDDVLVVQKNPDAISVLEESWRADAFRFALKDKARRFDDAMVVDHLDPVTGMAISRDPGSRGVAMSGDACLWHACWIASQAWRYEATGDPVALANVEKGLKALILCVDAPGNPAEFARAVADASTAPASWPRPAAFPGVAYLPGGNNDMMHGLDYGFAVAERILPSGHPLLAEIGRCAKSLVLNHKEAKGGSHRMHLSGVAWRLTGDPAMKSAYKKAATWAPLVRLWLGAGEGVFSFQGIGDWSGHHLATCTLIKFRLFGGKKPGFLEHTWRWLANTGAKLAASREAPWRSGLISIVGAAAGGSTTQLGKDVLAEVPCPRALGPAVIDRSIDPTFCLSPYPALPWKLDWKTNAGRQQSINGYPWFQHPDSAYFWKDNPLGGWRTHVGTLREPPQDFLHPYWYGRATGVLGPND